MDQQNDPLGLRWLPMLALYSNIGKQSNSNEEKCELGAQLKQLDGKHEVVINGINEKLESLIQAGGLNLSDDDMADLKQRIVDKLGEVASSANTQSSAPVSCNFDGIVFDESAKQILTDVVHKEVQSLKGENPVPVDTDALSTLIDENIAQRFTRQGESLVAIEQKQDDLTRVMTSSLQAVHNRLSNLTFGEAGDATATHRDQNMVPAEETEEQLPDGYDEEFYQNDLEAVIQMFREKDERFF